jgi:RNA polymerase sigma factor (sigma-70 family)
MSETDVLAGRFEEHRSRLRAVAYRMLGSLAEAEDAVQDAWLVLSRTGADEIENLGGWLTTAVSRECLHVLRSRRRRKEEPFADHLPDPVVLPDSDLDPEQEMLLADSIGLALLILLDSLSPAERVAFVLHDMFQVPFGEIALVLGRTPAAVRQLASRARRRVREADVPSSDEDLARQREVVAAFLAAAREGNFDALLQVLDPEVVLHTDLAADGRAAVYRGVEPVAKFAREPKGARLYPAVVNGGAGVVVTIHGVPHSVMAFTVVHRRIVEIDGIRDPGRVRRIAAAVLGEAEDAGDAPSRRVSHCDLQPRGGVVDETVKRLIVTPRANGW